jgi:hypothetical protein
MCEQLCLPCFPFLVRMLRMPSTPPMCHLYSLVQDYYEHADGFLLPITHILYAFSEALGAG